MKLADILKTAKGHIVLAVLGTIVLAGAIYIANRQAVYQESIRSSLTFAEEDTVEYGTDPMSLIVDQKADTVSFVETRDAEGNAVDHPKVGIPYTLVYQAVSNQHPTIFTKEITCKDSYAPVINGVTNSIEIPFGSTYHALDGISANDAVDGTVDITVSGSVDTKVPGTTTLTYSAVDQSGNTATQTSTVTVDIPACGANAAWNGSDCVCNSGYQGNGWSGCTAIPVKKYYASTSGTAESAAGSAGSSTASSGSTSDGSSASGQNAPDSGSSSSGDLSSWENQRDAQMDSDMGDSGHGYGGWTDENGNMMFDY